MSSMKPEQTPSCCGPDAGESSPPPADQGEAAGSCCGDRPAALGQAETPAPAADAPGTRREGRGKSWRDYVPLMIIVALTLGAAAAKQAHYQGGWEWMSWMHDFMGFFLIVFSMLKFFNMEGFADGFQMYDLLAQRSRPYAFLYPYLELGLGLGYLAHFQPLLIYAATVVLMGFGSLGVFNALRKNLDLNCACMGTILNVPLSTVALVEDLGMAAMAAAMLLMVLLA
jgi:hypothetical protein